MGKEILLKYGRKPLPIASPPGLGQILRPQKYPAAKSVPAELKRALANPFGKPPLREYAQGKKSVALLLSDVSRHYPRAEMLRTVEAELKAAGVSEIRAISASGNHPHYPHEEAELGPELGPRFHLLRNNSKNLTEFKYVGSTSSRVTNFFLDYAVNELKESLAHIPEEIQAVAAALKSANFRRAKEVLKPVFFSNMLMALTAATRTRVFIKKEAAEADLRVTLGQIKPHYFAGYGGGAKSVLPGVSAVATIAPNHFMKAHPISRLGVIENNVVRQDMEEAARLVEPLFIFNAVMNGDGRLAQAVAGDVVEAHRAGVKVAAQIANIPARKTDVVIMSAGTPTSIDIYQMTKVVAPAAMLIKAHGVIICAGECHLGVGGALVINQVIFNLGLRRYLPPDVDIYLVSSLPQKEVETTFFKYAPSVEAALAWAREKLGAQAEVTVVPDGAMMVPLTGGEFDAAIYKG